VYCLWKYFCETIGGPQKGSTIALPPCAPAALDPHVPDVGQSASLPISHATGSASPVSISLGRPIPEFGDQLFGVRTQRIV